MYFEKSTLDRMVIVLKHIFTPIIQMRSIAFASSSKILFVTEFVDSFAFSAIESLLRLIMEYFVIGFAPPYI